MPVDKTMIVYTNGDSYMTVSDGKTISDFLGEELNCPIKPMAVAGSCNSRIIRTTLRDLIELKKQEKEIFAVISLTFPLRTEVWNEEIQKEKWKHSNDGGFATYQFAKNKSWIDSINFEVDRNSRIPEELKSYGKHWLINYNIEAETTNLLKECLLLTNWLQNNQISYVLYSGILQENIAIDCPFVKPFYDELKRDRNIIDFFSESFTEWCLSKGHQPIDDYTCEIHGKTFIIGHHGEQAHRDWAKHLIENYYGKQ